MLTTAWGAHAGWKGDWLGRLWAALTERGVSIRGGKGMQPAISGDAVLHTLVVAATEEERAKVACGCWRHEVYTTADLTLPDGKTLRPEAREGGYWNKLGGDSTGWLAVVRRHLGAMTSTIPPEHQLSAGSRRGRSWHRRGRTVAWATQDG